MIANRPLILDEFQFLPVKLLSVAQVQLNAIQCRETRLVINTIKRKISDIIAY